MSILPTDDAIARFKANEERVDIFVNDPLSTGYYTTNETVPRQVKTLPELADGIVESASLRADLVSNTAGKGASLVTFIGPDSNPYTVADLASDATGKGDALLRTKQPFTGAVARTQHDKNQEWVSVLDFGAVGNGVTNDAPAFQAMFDFLRGKYAKHVLIPNPQVNYLFNETVWLRNQQGLTIHGNNSRIHSNFDGPTLRLGDRSTTTDDILRCHIHQLEIVNLSTSSNSRALQCEHVYESSFNGCYIYGGSYALWLDGNMVAFNDCTFRKGYLANVKTGQYANNEINVFNRCANELSTGYGYDLSVASGESGFTVIRDCYCEGNELGEILISNAQKTIIDSVYFNIQKGQSGIILGGTNGPSYPEQRVIIKNCRVEGPPVETANFIEELSDSSINCRYENNSIRGGNVALYDNAQKSINAAAKLEKVWISNKFFDGSPITNWTISSTVPSKINSFSPYGGDGGVKLQGFGYIHQSLSVPVGKTLKITVHAKVTDGSVASIGIFDNAIETSLASASTTSATGTDMTLYWKSTVPNPRILLRCMTASGEVFFDRPEITDMTT